jgi:magnesium transporter
MITIYENGESGLSTADVISPGTWVNVVDPDETDIAAIRQELGISRDFLRASLDVDERSRTDKEGTNTLVLLRTPIFRGRSEDVPYSTHPLGIIITPDAIVTICNEEDEIIQDFITGAVMDFSTTKPNRFILRIFLRTANRYLRHLRDINREVDFLEDTLQLSLRNEELLELLKYQKSLVYFTTSLRSNELMMERLQRSGLFQKFPDDTDLLDDVLTENRQAIEMVGVANDILSQMMDAFASIISNNLNVVMKLLTSITIVLMLPTLIASLYGMNVGLPLQDSPYAFLITLVVSFGLASAVVLVFLKKDWF